MGTILNERREVTRKRQEEIAASLTKSKELAKGKACIYATGSFARGEASLHSDLDLFIVGLSEPVNEEPAPGRTVQHKRVLKRLDEICIKAELIELTKTLEIPQFSGDGEYLQHYTVEELIRHLGKPEDDAANTFTARLLLLLESIPIVENDVYEGAIEETVAAYWRDFEDHSKDFIPAFLANDILRLWRTFCVNYEARTEREPDIKKAKRRLKNYKLKHSRLLTCYSALLYLLQVFASNGTVEPQHAIAMAKLTPTGRLETLMGTSAGLNATGAELIQRYEDFLHETDASEDDLLRKFSDSAESKRLSQQASVFGDKVFELMNLVGGKQPNKFYRLLVV